MITQKQQKQGAKLMNTLIQKSWESAAFKEQLIENPVLVIESVTGEKMKEDTKIMAEDQTDHSSIYLNIPRKPNLDELELTEEELNKVSGGVTLALIGVGCALIGVGKLIGDCFDDVPGG